MSLTFLNATFYNAYKHKCFVVFAADRRCHQTVIWRGVRRPFVFWTNIDLIRISLLWFEIQAPTHPPTMIVTLCQRLDLYLELFGRDQWKQARLPHRKLQDSNSLTSLQSYQSQSAELVSIPTKSKVSIPAFLQPPTSASTGTSAIVSELCQNSHI